MGDDTNAAKNIWAKLDALAKVIAATSAIVGTIYIPYVIQANAEQSRMSQAYMQVMTEREKADTGIREQMFKTLLERYLGEFKADPQNLREFKRRIVFLDVLTLNFQEFLNAKPLFEDLHDRIVEYERRIHDMRAPALKEDLQRVARRAAARQVAMLAAKAVEFGVGNASHQDRACVRLYEVVGLSDGKEEQLQNPRDGWDCRDDAVLTPSRAGTAPAEEERQEYAITIKLTDMHESGVKVQVTPYLQHFRARRLTRNDPLVKPLDFEVSYFDLPYMDNTKLFGGKRFALLLKRMEGKDHAFMEAVTFDEQFVSLRDRPYFEEMLRKLRQREPAG